MSHNDDESLALIPKVVLPPAFVDYRLQLNFVSHNTHVSLDANLLALVDSL